MSELCHNESEYNYHTFYIINAVFSSLCAVCCLVVIYSYIRFKRIVSEEYRIVFFLQITDLIYAISNLFFPKCEQMDQRYNLCIFQGFLNNTTYYSSTLFTALITQILCCSIVINKRRTRLYDRKHWCLYLSIGYGIPLVLGVLPFTTHSYGIADYWCFFPYTTKYDTRFQEKDLYMPKVYTYLQYGIVWLIIIHNFFFFGLMFYHVQRTRKYALRRNLCILFMIPLVLFISWIQPSINRLILNWHHQDAKFSMALTQVIFNSLLGYVNFFIYGLNSTIRKQIMANCCPCCLRRHHKDSVFYAIHSDAKSVSSQASYSSLQHL